MRHPCERGSSNEQIICHQMSMTYANKHSVAQETLEKVIDVKKFLIEEKEGPVMGVGSPFAINEGLAKAGDVGRISYG